MFALLKLAVPIAFLPSQSTLQETVELLKLSGVTCLFASGQLYPHAAAAAKAIGLPEEGIFILQGDVTGKVSLPSLIENVKARGLSKTATRTVQDDTLAYIMFSSGTTGLPKGYFVHVNLPHFFDGTLMDLAIMISHRNMIFSTSQLEGINEEIAKVYPVRCPYTRQECEDNFQIAGRRENSCSFGGLTLVSCNGRTCLYVPAIHRPQHVSRIASLAC